jgi:hypothetical protein
MAILKTVASLFLNGPVSCDTTFILLKIRLSTLLTHLFARVVYISYSPTNIRIVKSRRTSWTARVARMEEPINACENLDGKT